MDTSVFFDRLTEVFDGDPQHVDPRDPQWKALAGQIAGYTAPNELAVLNLAAKLLPEDEAYLEVGTFKGRSICAAAIGNHGKKLVAMENFMEFGMAGLEARAELLDNIDRFAQDAQVELLEGDCFKLMHGKGALDRKVGVYFYDGEHTLLSHYLALAVAEPLLADEALILVDDASWPLVQRAHKLYMDRHPGWTLAREWDARHADDERWANGLHVLTFKRPQGRAARLSRVDEALRVYQVNVQDRVNAVMWKAAGVIPGPMTKVAKVLLGRSREISGLDAAPHKPTTGVPHDVPAGDSAPRQASPVPENSPEIQGGSKADER